MSISKLTLLSPRPAASDADSFAAAASRRGNPSPEDAADAPSFDEALQESRNQYTKAPTAAPDAAPAKPSKQKATDDQSSDTDGAQSATAENPPPSDKAPEKKADDADSKPAAPGTDAKDHPTGPTVDPSTVVIVQAPSALLQTLAAPSPPGASGSKQAASKIVSQAKPGDPGAAPAQAATSPAKEKATPADGVPAAKADTQPDGEAEASKGPQPSQPTLDPRKVHRPPNASDPLANAHTIVPPPTAVAATPTPTAADMASIPAIPPPNNLPTKPDTSGGDPVPLLTVMAAPPHPGSTAEAAHIAQDSPAAASTDPMDQIVLGLKSTMDPRTGKAEIRLDPPNLGVVKVSLTLQSGSLTAQFESASEVVRDLLKSHLDRLKTVLESQGVAVDKLAVEPPANTQSQGQASSFGSASHDGRSAGQYQQDPRQQRGNPDTEAFAGLFSKAQDAPLDLVA